MTRNKPLNYLWKLNAVTLSAQVLTLPVILYYFKQFPLLFPITNLLAIPLSGIILTGEIILCCFSFHPVASYYLGNVLSWLIRLMNGTIVYIDRLPFSSIKNVEISFLQVILLYVFITFISLWLCAKKKYGLLAALVTMTLFFIAEAVKLWQ
jgi:competence protein ComEC